MDMQNKPLMGDIDGDAIVLLTAVLVISALAAFVFCCAPRLGVEVRFPVCPKETDIVTYGEFSNDGSLWHARVYAFRGGHWEVSGSCYPSTGKGCRAEWKEIVYSPVASVAGHQRVEIDSDRHGFLRHLHPKSKFVDDDALWTDVQGLVPGS